MLTADELKRKWDGLPQYGGGYTRIDAQHPLEFYIGYESISQKTLLLICNYEPKSADSSKSITVTAGKRQDEKWAVCFRLTEKDQEEVFMHFCCDIIESSRTQNNNELGIKFVIDRYIQWHRLMEYQGSGLMSEAQRKGLLGEVIYLHYLIENGMPKEEAVNGWIGPEGADRDFVYSDTWYEIKSEGVASKTVKISSLEQLDVPNCGELIICFIDKTSPYDGSFSLKGKIDKVKLELSEDTDTLNSFNSKLLKYGYIDLKEYEEQQYVFGGFLRYIVNDNFPKLTKNNIPSQVVTTVYEISLSAIEDWKI